MSQVFYHSTHASASGVSHPRDGGELIFHDQPAGLTMSYTYDASIVGVVQGGTTTFTVPDLVVRVDVPGYFAAWASPGTIAWTGDTIDFHAAYSVMPFEAPSVVVDAIFVGVYLGSASSFPSSLAGLEGVYGAFTAHETASIAVRSSGDAWGTAVSAPEPASALLLAIGLIGAIIHHSICRRGATV